MNEDIELVTILEIPYVLKKDDMYYAHNSSGYVHSPLMAELYTEEYAKSHAATCEELEAIPITELFSDSEYVEGFLDRIQAIYNAVLMKENMKSLGEKL